ncbi:MAG: patatin-like phospholipase family protein [Pseudomonadota bacterium]|nr:patatin-like phospholipase family protein [Syntrophaceae bacterium]MBP7033921.1 patatin-like phospholipase family protein [Syntrophobacterales bacterium]MDI9554401.1 patatin-like phospholipase family protein [Pseudomonadota bacterium]NLX30150.1 patatin-like phospholipase family protein [Deltaproteobacteria bacterium]HNU84773.1 patatin-like phospholipase family protein [Syntrophales bacterium]
MRKKRTKTVNLALQGGGAHGAFAWGVMDRFLEDGRIEIEGISATSAGTLNAIAYGWGAMRGGPEGAREALEDLWREVSRAGALYSPVRQLPLDRSWPGAMAFSGLTFGLFSAWTRLLSPYQFNPLDFNPLREMLRNCIDFEELVRCDCVDLFVSATNVRTGQVRVFRNEEITPEVVLASACLPDLFQAVEIDGEHYWDGGYMGNPSLFPLFYYTRSRDIIIVHINPIERDEIPRTAMDIENRLNEITFNASLLKELRAIAFVVKLLEEKWIRDEYREKLKHVLIHSVRADEALKDLGVATKFVSNWEFLTDLRDRGRETAGRWLAENFDCLGQRSSIDVRTAYLQRGSDRPLTRTT